MTSELIRAERCRRSLAVFVQTAWEIVEPAAPLIWGPHLDAVCDHLQAVTEGHIHDLLINIPPGHSKSLIVAVLWPAWEWTRQPQIRTISASYSGDLSTRDSNRSRDVINSSWFRTHFQDGWRIRDDIDSKSHYANTVAGERLAISVGAKATGFRGDKLIVDDPLNALDAASPAARLKCLTWFTQSMSSRFNNMKERRRVVIMQRLHEEDLAQYCIDSGFEHLCLPSRFESERKCVTKLPFEDWRQEDGDLLFPEMFDERVLQQAEKDLGSAGFAAQHQQRPAPAGGLVFKTHWFTFWSWTDGLKPVMVRVDEGKDSRIHTCPLIPRPREFDVQILSVDCSFKDTEESDYVVVQLWGKKGGKVYLLDQVRGQWSFTRTLKEIEAFCEKHPKAGAKLIEDKANGTAVIDSLKKKIPGIIAVEPEGGKESRANAVTPFFESGDVVVPHPDEATWVREYMAEMTNFPKARKDDQVDGTTQALSRLCLGKIRRYRGAVG